MGNRWKIISETGLQFFGKMNASISHEIKNVLAIINENAGLLEDFTRMADKGVAFDPEKLRVLAGKIQAQVQRADGIVENMNTFAHSVDDPIKKIDIGGLLVFMATLSRRLASMRGISFNPILPGNSLEITTNPFLLETVLWLCMDFSMTVVGPEKTIEVSANTGDQCIAIYFSGLDALDEHQDSTFPGERERALVDALNGEIVVHGEAKEIVLHLPFSLGGA